jgi:HK97 family phage major capsid protein
MMSNQELLQKADFALADLTAGSGTLAPAQSQAFMRLLIKEAALLGLTTVTGMKAQKQDIEQIRFTDRILRAGHEATALSEADRAKPDLDMVELDAKLFKAEVRMSAETLEDSIEQGQLKNTIMTLMAERISLDMDEIIVRGDITSTDPFLAQFDGLLAQVTTNTYDHLDNPTNRALFKAMLKSMPSQYVRNKKALRFLTSVDSLIDYRDALADRATANVGDRFVEQDAPAMYSGVPVIDIPNFPENIGTSTHCTDVVLTDPKNLNVGIWRNIQVETDKLIREGVVLVVATLRFDMKLAVEEAAVKATNVKVA